MKGGTEGCREESGLLAGLWEFPSVPGRLTAAEAAAEAGRLGAKVLSCAPCGEARHVFTHIEWHMTGYQLELETEAGGLTWKTAVEIRGNYSIPTALKAYLKKIR